VDMIVNINVINAKMNYKNVKSKYKSNYDVIIQMITNVMKLKRN